MKTPGEGKGGKVQQLTPVDTQVRPPQKKVRRRGVAGENLDAPKEALEGGTTRFRAQHFGQSGGSA